MQILTLKELKNLVLGGEVVDTSAHVQVDGVITKTTKDGKPYYEVHFVDHCDRILLRAWNDHARLRAVRFPGRRTLRGNQRGVLQARRFRIGGAAVASAPS